MFFQKAVKKKEVRGTNIRSVDDAMVLSLAVLSHLKEIEAQGCKKRLLRAQHTVGEVKGERTNIMGKMGGNSIAAVALPPPVFGKG